MDPLHITEFASERYFSKLRQLNGNAETAGPAAGSASESTTSTQPPVQSQTFDLPLILRQQPIVHEPIPLRPSDQKKRSLGHDLTSLRTQRRPSFTGSFGSLRAKYTVVHKAPTVPILVEHHEQMVAEEGGVHPGYVQSFTVDMTIANLYSLTLSDLFLSLPNELQEQIIAPLPIHDILTLRLVSKSFHTFVTLNENPIARFHVAHSLPPYALRLYPYNNLAEINLHYLCGIWHRLHIASKLSVMISRQTVKEIFLKKTEAELRDFEPQHRRMRQRLMAIVFTLLHFFETYRDLHVRHLADGGIPLNRQAFTINPIEQKVLSMYDDQTLLQVHLGWTVVISSFSRRLRPPSYAGGLERAIKGYLKDRPADEVYTAILTVGGLRQAQRFWETKGYGARRDAVDVWYGLITRNPVPVEPVAVLKSKMSLLHLGRRRKEKDAMLAVEASKPEGTTHDATSCNEWFCVKPSCQAARRRHSTDNLVFHSSLASGPPMGPLSQSHLALLLPDLQHLSNIWIHTAEAMILDRKIVARPQDIKKNAAVFLELIRDNGNDDTDEWSSGNLRTINSREPQEGMGASGGVSD